ncbi:hypothetical protein [Hymenobacter coccineus]|uniref:hypothetical protein n=1 Tax=Hymenobacter coccineus TaxID=1908235 RepID=UPI0009F4B909|nr:hypothetical protein [Hymenobacter coccineus]
MVIAQAHRLAPLAGPKARELARLQGPQPRPVGALVDVVGAAVAQLAAGPINADLLLGQREQVAAAQAAELPGFELAGPDEQPRRQRGAGAQPVLEALRPRAGIEVVNKRREADLNGQHHQRKAQHQLVADQHVSRTGLQNRLSLRAQRSGA